MNLVREQAWLASPVPSAGTVADRHGRAPIADGMDEHSSSGAAKTSMDKPV